MIDISLPSKMYSINMHFIILFLCNFDLIVLYYYVKGIISWYEASEFHTFIPQSLATQVLQFYLLCMQGGGGGGGVGWGLNPET
jgi:hypothetical protein